MLNNRGAPRVHVLQRHRIGLRARPSTLVLRNLDRIIHSVSVIWLRRTVISREPGPRTMALQQSKPDIFAVASYRIATAPHNKVTHVTDVIT